MDPEGNYNVTYLLLDHRPNQSVKYKVYFVVYQPEQLDCLLLLLNSSFKLH